MKLQRDHTTANAFLVELPDSAPHSYEQYLDAMATGRYGHVDDPGFKNVDEWNRHRRNRAIIESPAALWLASEGIVPTWDNTSNVPWGWTARVIFDNEMDAAMFEQRFG